MSGSKRKTRADRWERALALIGLTFLACAEDRLDLGGNVGSGTGSGGAPPEQPEFFISTAEAVSLRAEATHVYWALPEASNPSGVFACEAGRCQSSIVELPAAWSRFSFNAGRVVFPVATEHSVTLRGCEAPSCLASRDLLTTRSLVMDGVSAGTEGVYFRASDDTLYACPWSGCDAHLRAVVAPFPHFQRAVARDGHLYMLVTSQFMNETKLTLLAVRLGGEYPGVALEYDMGMGDSELFDVARSGVYWIDHEFGKPETRSIRKCELLQCARGRTRVVSVGQGCRLQRILVDDVTDQLYWLDRCDGPEGAGVVLRCQLPGCAGEPEIVTPGPSQFVDFALSPGSLWLAQAAVDGTQPGLERRNR